MIPPDVIGGTSVLHLLAAHREGRWRPAQDLPSLARQIANLVSSKRRYLPEISLPHVGNIGSAFGAFDELLINDYLVCFDDLERRNNQLDIEQLFGFVSLLKEQNGCRVVIICNESELGEDDARRLQRYREKIVDRQLTYEPLFEQNFRIVFADSVPAIRDVFEAVGLNNIRVFQQTKWCIDYFAPHVSNCHAEFVDGFNQQAARLASVHFALSKDITVEGLRATSWLGVSLSDRDGLSQTAKDIVRNLQFLPSDADDYIIDYLRNGYCDTEALRVTVERLNQEHRRREADQRLTEIWAQAWYSYQSDATQIAVAADEYVTQYREYIPYKYAADLLDFVKKILPEFDAESRKRLVATAVIPTADAGTLKVIESSCDSPDVKEEAKRRRTDLQSRKSIDQLVLSLGESDGWNPGAFADLNQYSEDELLNWLSGAHHRYLLTTLAEVVARGQLESADNKGGHAVGVKFRRVFDRLATRNPLDMERTKHAFALIRRQLAQYGRNISPDICPPQPDKQIGAET